MQGYGAKPEYAYAALTAGKYCSCGNMPPKEERSLNVEYHVTVLLMNIAVATTIKPVGFRLEMDLRVSI